jgi:four helix bundle protein
MIDLKKRTFDFAIMTLDLLEKLEINKISSIVVTQLAKSGTSVGANYEESQGTHSKKDFYHKIGICLREIRESNYWLRIISVKKWGSDKDQLNSLLKESEEIKLIFGKIFSKRLND